MAVTGAESGELPALTSATFFTKTRRGERVDIESVDRFFVELEGELFLTEGNRGRALAVAERIRAKRFPSVGLMREGYAAHEVRDSLDALADDLSADPASERNSLVLSIETFRSELDALDASESESESETEQAAAAAAPEAPSYDPASVREALNQAEAFARRGDTHETHEALRGWRRTLQLADAVGERGYPKQVVDVFFASLVSAYCSQPLSDS